MCPHLHVSSNIHIINVHVFVVIFEIRRGWEGEEGKSESETFSLTAFHPTSLIFHFSLSFFLYLSLSTNPISLTFSLNSPLFTKGERRKEGVKKGWKIGRMEQEEREVRGEREERERGDKEKSSSLNKCFFCRKTWEEVVYLSTNGQHIRKPDLTVHYREHFHFTSMKFVSRNIENILIGKSLYWYSSFKTFQNFNF